MLREELQRIGKGTAGDTNDGARTEDTRMKLMHKLFPLGHFLISLLFVGCGLAFITFAGLQLWQGIQPGMGWRWPSASIRC